MTSADRVREIPPFWPFRYDWRNNSVLFVHNFDEKPREGFVLGWPFTVTKEST